MVVLYLGNFLPDYSTETHISKTLKSMGHTVIQVQENFTQPEHLAERLRHEKFDLFLFTRTWGQTLKNDHLSILEKRKIPSASYHLDLYYGLQRDGGLGSDPFWRTDFVFTPDGDPKSAKYFKKHGIKHYYLKPGVYKDECQLFPVEKTKAIIFVGSYSYHPEWPYRQDLINWLKNNFFNEFEHWGPEGMGHIRGEELSRLYSTTKIVIGDSLHLPGHDYYWSDRVYETLGRGGFLIHPYIKGLEEEFTDKKHLVFYEYGNFDQLKELINYYLAENEEREAIRQAGHEFVKHNATYTQRLTRALKIIEESKNVKAAV